MSRSCRLRSGLSGPWANFEVFVGVFRGSRRDLGMRSVSRGLCSVALAVCGQLATGLQFESLLVYTVLAVSAVS